MIIICDKFWYLIFFQIYFIWIKTFPVARMPCKSSNRIHMEEICLKSFSVDRTLGILKKIEDIFKEEIKVETSLKNIAIRNYFDYHDITSVKCSEVNLWLWNSADEIYNFRLCFENLRQYPLLRCTHYRNIWNFSWWFNTNQLHTCKSIASPMQIVRV